jgi:hypothetical protein
MTASGFEREAAHQQLLANGIRQKSGLAVHRGEGIVATRARVYEHSQPVGSGLGRWKSRERPRLG